MNTRTALIVLLVALTMAWLAGCGGGMSEADFALTGTVFGPASTRGAASQISYDPAFDYMVYVADPVTLEKIGNEVRTNYRGEFSLRSVPAHGDILIVAERDGIMLRACVSEADRIASPTCHVSPDTTVATATAQQLRIYEVPDEIIHIVYTDCLQYQAANRFAYGHCNGSLCDLTNVSDVNLTGRELMRIAVDNAISPALQNHELDQCTKMVALVMADLALNDGCGLTLSAEQQARLAQFTTFGDVITAAQALAFINNAGIVMGLIPPAPVGGAVTEDALNQARLRLNGKYAALTEGGRTGICAAELIMLCCQLGDLQVPFRARSQQELDALVNQVAPVP